MDPRIRLIGYTALMTEPGAIKPHTSIAELQIAAPIALTKPQVRVDTAFTLIPMLRRRVHAADVLGLISNTTREILEGIEALE
jgi:hypothetical protein